MHSGLGVGRFVGMYALGGIFPLTAGVLLMGWRALGTVLIVSLCSLTATFIWRRIGARGAQLRYDHALWGAMLLAMTLPAELCAGARPPLDRMTLWPVLASAGIVLVIFYWLLGGLGSGRVHPVLVTHLLLFLCFKQLLVPNYVLQRQRVFSGDLFNAMPADVRESISSQPWTRAPNVPGFDSMKVTPASQTLLAFTTGKAAEPEQNGWLSLDALLRDRMPPLEDLIVGGHPAPIGSASAIAVIIGGLFLLYRGLIDYRVPLLIILAALATMLLLPVPVVVKENEAVWRWVPMRMGDVGWQLGLTLANYEVMAGPLLFTAFFLASAPAVRPIARRARVVYALLGGVLAGVFQLYVSVAIGPYLALLAASLLTPTLDKWIGPRTLV